MLNNVGQLMKLLYESASIKNNYFSIDCSKAILNYTFYKITLTQGSPSASIGFQNQCPKEIDILQKRNFYLNLFLYFEMFTSDLYPIIEF